jgi:hypothetical protein
VVSIIFCTFVVEEATTGDSVGFEAKFETKNFPKKVA